MKQVIEFILEILVVMFILAFVVVLNIGTAWFQCYRAAKELGYNCTYKVMVGCVVEKPDGKKVLLRQMRNYIDE